MALIGGSNGTTILAITHQDEVLAWSHQGVLDESSSHRVVSLHVGADKVA